MESESIVWPLHIFLIIAEYLHYNMHRRSVLARALAILSQGFFFYVSDKTQSAAML